MAVRSLMAGMEPAMESMVSITFLVRSMEVPGGMLTAAMMVPVSSSGTMPEGVMFISHTSMAMHTAVMPSEIHLWCTNHPVSLR